MTITTTLRALGLATATLACAAVLSPANATPKAAPPPFTAPTDKVLAACDRTVGCSYTTTGGVTTGCSPNVCFVCSGKSCSPLVVKKGGQNPVGHVPVVQASGAGASTTLKAQVRTAAVGGGAAHPVAVGGGAAHPVAVGHPAGPAGHKR
jgi:hypothetical protein